MSAERGDEACRVQGTEPSSAGASTLRGVAEDSAGASSIDASGDGSPQDEQSDHEGERDADAQNEEERPQPAKGLWNLVDELFGLGEWRAP